ncbi:MAG: hydroxyethylthiazole kinase [Oscillibacter sp.]
MNDCKAYAACLRAVRERAPLVQVITNFVTVNDCANVILAAGGSPTMARDIREAAEVAENCAGLVVNLGAIEDAEAMFAAGARANALGHPVVLDPVAAGGSALRRTVSARLLRELRFAVIRGNHSEIKALALGIGAGSGVDVAPGDVVTEESLSGAIALAKNLAKQTGAVVVISGALDVVAEAERAVVLRNGCATMAKITGSGCMLSALTGAFCAAMPENSFDAAVAATAALGICGERAEVRRLQNGTGTATFRTDLIDGVSLLTEEQLLGGIHCEND